MANVSYYPLVSTLLINFHNLTQAAEQTTRDQLSALQVGYVNIPIHTIHNVRRIDVSQKE